MLEVVRPFDRLRVSGGGWRKGVEREDTLTLTLSQDGRGERRGTLVLRQAQDELGDWFRMSGMEGVGRGERCPHPRIKYGAGSNLLPGREKGKEGRVGRAEEVERGMNPTCHFVKSVA